MIKTLYDLNNFVVLAARLPQIYKNYKVGSQKIHVFLSFCLQTCSFRKIQKEVGQITGQATMPIF